MVTVRLNLLDGALQELKCTIKSLEQLLDTCYSIISSLERTSRYDDLLPQLHKQVEQIFVQKRQMKFMADSLENIISCYGGSEDYIVERGIELKKLFNTRNI